MQILPIPCTQGTLPWQPLFWFSMGYKFSCMITSDTLFDSRGGFSGTSYIQWRYSRDQRSIRDVAMATNFETILAANGLWREITTWEFRIKDGLFQSTLASVGRSFWIRSCDDRNCSRRATVRLGIDTLIANILFFSVHRIFDVPGPIFAKLCHTTRYVLK